mmetsp:Transcript_12731/g.47636  ORF Transcript_12731/g.47636 Transcript_12731/m.47636 type:complete len:210 (+) Transcript_12731:1271-1900(+)
MDLFRFRVCICKNTARATPRTPRRRVHRRRRQPAYQHQTVVVESLDRSRGKRGLRKQRGRVRVRIFGLDSRCADFQPFHPLGATTTTARARFCRRTSGHARTVAVVVVVGRPTPIACHRGAPLAAQLSLSWTSQTALFVCVDLRWSHYSFTRPTQRHPLRRRPTYKPINTLCSPGADCAYRTALVCRTSTPRVESSTATGTAPRPSRTP